MEGDNGPYHWLTDVTHRIDDVLAFCPEVVLGKYLAVTSCDSAPLNIGFERLEKAGWHSENEIAYSPQITSLKLLPPHGLYDEWYVLEEPTTLQGLAADAISARESGPGRLITFVNYAEFVFDPGNEHLADSFWRQIELIRPHSYLAESDPRWLTFVTRDGTLFNSVHNGLNGLAR